MATPSVKVTVNDRPLIALIKEIEAMGTPVRIVADGTNYGIHQEFGEHGKPFMKPALAANKKTLTRGMKAAGDDMSKLGVVLDQVASNVKEDAQNFVKVDTGNLKNSLHVVDPEKETFTYEVPGR